MSDSQFSVAAGVVRGTRKARPVPTADEHYAYIEELGWPKPTLQLKGLGFGGEFTGGNMHITRPEKIEVLDELLREDLAVIITGPQRIGKSMLYNLMIKKRMESGKDAATIWLPDRSMQASWREDKVYSFPEGLAAIRQRASSSLQGSVLVGMDESSLLAFPGGRHNISGGSGAGFTDAEYELFREFVEDITSGKLPCQLLLCGTDFSVFDASDRNWQAGLKLGTFIVKDPDITEILDPTVSSLRERAPELSRAKARNLVTAAHAAAGDYFPLTLTILRAVLASRLEHHSGITNLMASSCDGVQNGRMQVSKLVTQDNHWLGDEYPRPDPITDFILQENALGRLGTKSVWQFAQAGIAANAMWLFSRSEYYLYMSTQCLSALNLYQDEVLAGETIAFDDENEIHQTLINSGICKVDNGQLRTRGKPFERFFTDEWCDLFRDFVAPNGVREVIEGSSLEPWQFSRERLRILNARGREVGFAR